MQNKAALFNVFCLVAVIAMSLVSILLAIENHRLKVLPASVPTKINYLSELIVDVGGGQLTTIDCSTSLVFFLAADCPYCQRTILAWNAIARTASDQGWKVIGVLVKGGYEDAQRVKNEGADFPIFVSGDPSLTTNLDLLGVPTTLVIHEGEVLAHWTGEPEAGFYEDVINFISHNT